MRLLLIQSYLGRKENPILPLGLSYLADSLKGHEVYIFDPNIEDDPYASMRKAILDFRPELVGVSLRNIDTTSYKDTHYYYKTLDPTLDIIKENAPSSYIVIGGAGFSLFARDIMERHPAIDFGVYLEGEKNFPELIDNLTHPKNVKGIYYRQNNKVLFSGMGNMPDLEDISPALDFLKLPGYKTNGESVGVQSKRGCALNCSYCTYPFLAGHNVRMRPHEKVVDEIERLVNKYGITQFTFADTVFNVPKQHAVSICEEIIKRNVEVKWCAFFSLKDVDEEFLNLAANAGCYLFIFSPDGYSDDTLKALSKEITMTDIRRVYNCAKRFKTSRFEFSFLVNAPGQDYLHFLRLLWLLIKTNFILPRRKFMHVSINMPRIEPYTGLYDLAIKEGTLRPDQSLLPPDSNAMRDVYYHNPNIKPVEDLFKFLLFIKNMLDRFKKKKSIPACSCRPDKSLIKEN